MTIVGQGSLSEQLVFERPAGAAVPTANEKAEGIEGEKVLRSRKRCV